MSEERLVFKIRGLDCAEEVAILRREVGPLVGGADRLSFDVLNARMSAPDLGGAEGADRIREAIARAGMEAIPWSEAVAASALPGPSRGFWKLDGHGAGCIASGGLIAAGLASAAFAGNRGDGVASLFYLAAALTGAVAFVPKALLAARRFRPDMNLLMLIAVAGAIGIGERFEAATVAFLFSIALLLETWSIGRARHAISALMDLSPETARYLCPSGGETLVKPIEQVPIGAIVLVRPGEKIPLDGSVTRGETAVDQSPITGESVPVARVPGDEVFAGTINLDGAFEFRSTRAANETTLARIIRRVEEAGENRAPAEQWVERFARVYTPIMLALACVVAVAPPLAAGGGWSDWFYQALVILVISCPCALVISTPVSIVSGLASAARAGVLIKGGAFLEAPARLKVVALDKTGTLTRGRPVVQKLIPLNGHDEVELLDRAAALEANSLHPLGRAILERAEAAGLNIEAADDFHALEGRGAEARIDGRPFWIGSHRMVHGFDVETPGVHAMAEELEEAGQSLVMVGNREHVCGLIGLADAVRPEAKGIIAELKAAGIETVVMLTGDNRKIADAVAKATGVDRVRAELLPEDKVACIEELERAIGPVAMVGDGVNDAPAMAVSSLGVAMAAAGADAAIETADIALMSDDLSKLPWLIRHSRRTLRIIKQNIFFALGLKLVFIVLAFGGVAALWMAIAADTGASLLVIANGLRLLKAR